MSNVAWYRQKAAQCSKMAKSAADAHTRAEYIEVTQLWLQIAADIELHEKDQHGLKLR
jgi:hypothetical protein